MKTFFRIQLTLMLFVSFSQAGQYLTLCEGNFGQANASLWSINESISAIDGPLIWNNTTSPFGDVAQSLTTHDHQLFAVMNNSHEIRVMDMEPTMEHVGDISLPGASPRYMAVHRESNRGY